MSVTKVSREATIPTYTEALLLTESRKTCTNLAASVNKSHDSLYSEFRNPIPVIEKIKNDLEDIAQKALVGNKKILLLDESQVTKPHATNIEGLDVTFDGSSGRPELGLNMLTALLTDGNIRLPVEVTPYITQKIAGIFFKTKSALAITLSTILFNKFYIDLVLADAHYATKEFISFLAGMQKQFLMKITRTRIVTIDYQTGQLQKILRLRRNEHVRSASGIYAGIPCFFYAAKLKNGTTFFFIILRF